MGAVSLPTLPQIDKKAIAGLVPDGRQLVHVSRQISGDEGGSVKYIEEIRERPITQDSITVLPRPPGPRRIPTPVPTEPDLEDEPVDPQILLQESSAEVQDTESETQRTSGRANKGKFTSTKYADEDFDKGKRAHVAKMARNIDPNDEEEPATIQEAVNHPTRGKQWEKA